MKRASIMMLASLALVTSARVHAQVEGFRLVGVAAAALREASVGLSAKRQVLGQAVFNDRGERIGAVDDLIIAPDMAHSYAIIGAGGFLGVSRHDVAIPVSELKQVDGKFVLYGATKNVLEAMPAFEYPR